MKELKIKAKTIQNAIEEGLGKLSLRRDQVEVIVIDEGKKGLLGIGSKKACIVLTEKKWTDSENDSKPKQGQNFNQKKTYERNKPAHSTREKTAHNSRRPQREKVSSNKPCCGNSSHDKSGIQNNNNRPAAKKTSSNPQAQTSEIISEAKSILSQMLTLAGLKFEITDARYDQKTEKIRIKFSSEDSSLFTERSGKGIESVQYIVNAILNRTIKPHTLVQIDTASYWDRKEKDISKEVSYAAKEVKNTSQPFRLEPMSNLQRKLVHEIIKNDYPGLRTSSEGNGRWRKVVISQTGK